jgi:DNA-binding protein HU-beta
MNKTDLVNAIHEKSGLTKADAKKALDAMIEATTDALKNGDKVVLIGFGTFSVRLKKGGQVRNPRTGAMINVPDKNVVKFKAGADLKKAVE